MPAKWEEVEIVGKQNLFLFEATLHKRRHPLWNKTGTFITLHSKDWTNVVPVTKEGNIVLVEQYRHGLRENFIESPGGLIETGEEPIKAAKRECKEETGYFSDIEPELLAVVAPNPAFLDNHCHIFLWRDCQKQFKQDLDEHEDIRVFEASPKEVREMIHNGKITHSIAITALLLGLEKLLQ